ILDRMATTANHQAVRAVVSPAEILATRALVDQIYIDDKVKEYVVNIVFATREPAAYQLDLGPLIQYGASPRATLYLTLAAKAHAFLQGRGYVTPQDVKSIGPDVLRHRVIVTYEAEAEEVDASASTIFGSVTQLKSTLAAELGALFAFSAITNNDKVGLIIFTDRIELALRPRKGTRHVLRVIRDVLSVKPAGRGTDIPAALEHLGR